MSTVELARLMLGLEEKLHTFSQRLQALKPPSGSDLEKMLKGVLDDAKRELDALFERPEIRRVVAPANRGRGRRDPIPQEQRRRIMDAARTVAVLNTPGAPKRREELERAAQAFRNELRVAELPLADVVCASVKKSAE